MPALVSCTSKVYALFKRVLKENCLKTINIIHWSFNSMCNFV